LNDSREKLILASGSPRRRQLLQQAGHAFDVIVSDVEEDPPMPDLGPRLHAEMLAVQKARDVAGRLDSGIVLGADTVVESDGLVIGKPADPADARRILTRLSGTRHSVITGLCVWHVRPRIYVVGSERTVVHMRPMSPDQIDAYVDSGEAMGKAGAYAIQETGDRFVEDLEGHFDNVVGLPLTLLEQMLAVPVARTP